MAETRRLDAKGLLCPLPVLRASKALKLMAAGDRLVVEATDPGTVEDFPALCRSTGHRLLAWRREADIFIYEIEKAG